MQEYDVNQKMARFNELLARLIKKVEQKAKYFGRHDHDTVMLICEINAKITEIKTELLTDVCEALKQAPDVKRPDINCKGTGSWNGKPCMGCRSCDWVAAAAWREQQKKQ